MPKQAPYRWLAKYYDLVFGEFHAPLRQSRPAISSCGRGTAALKLTRLGIRKYGAICRLAGAGRRGAVQWDKGVWRYVSLSWNAPRLARVSEAGRGVRANDTSPGRMVAIRVLSGPNTERSETRGASHGC